MFDYYTTYWVTSDGWLNDLLLNGASDRGTEGGLNVWHFWQSEDAPVTDFSLSLSDVTRLVDGVVLASDADGVPLVFTPVTLSMVEEFPERFPWTDEERAAVETPGDIYLLLHAMEVPDSYEEEYGPPSARTEAVSSVMVFDEARGEEAPSGTVHFWASRAAWFKKQEDGSWLHMTAGQEWSDSHPDLPTSSLKAHTTPDGVLSSERQRLHKKILEGIFRGKKRVRNPTAIVTMGLPASGKSTLTSFLEDRPGDLAVLDADQHRLQIPEYQAAVALKARNAAIITHEEVSTLNDTAIDHALSEDPDEPGAYYPFILDGVGTSTAYYSSIIEDAVKKGYKVKVVMAHVRDTEDMTALDAVRIRAEDRGVRTGRFVKNEVFSKAKPLLAPSFKTLASKASSAVVMDVTDPTAPKQMFAQAGDTTVGNPSWMEEAKAKGTGMTDDELVALYSAAAKAEHEKLLKTEPKFKSGEGYDDPGIDAVPSSKQGSP